MMMNLNHIKTTAAHVAALRPTWDEQGIRAVLLKLQDRDPFDVAVAAVNAARDEKNRTPAVIAMAGDHWPSKAVQPGESRDERIRRQAEAQAAREVERERARQSRERARAACTACDEHGRLPNGAWCAHNPEAS